MERLAIVIEINTETHMGFHEQWIHTAATHCFHITVHLFKRVSWIAIKTGLFIRGIVILTITNIPKIQPSHSQNIAYEDFDTSFAKQLRWMDVSEQYRYANSSFCFLLETSALSWEWNPLIFVGVQVPWFKFFKYLLYCFLPTPPITTHHTIFTQYTLMPTKKAVFIPEHLIDNAECVLLKQN